MRPRTLEWVLVFILLTATVVSAISAADVYITYGVLTEENGVGTIEGVVEDIEGRPVANVTVTIEGTGHETLTDCNGTYELDNVPTGPHSLLFTRPGYRSLRVKLFVLDNGRAARLYGRGSNILDVTPYSGMYIRGPYVDLNRTERGAGGSLTIKADSTGHLAVVDPIGNRTVADIQNFSGEETFTEDNASLYHITYSWSGGRAEGDVVIADSVHRSIDLSDLNPGLCNVSIKCQGDGAVRIYRYTNGTMEEFENALRNESFMAWANTTLPMNDTLTLIEGVYYFAVYQPGRAVMLSGPYYIHNDTNISLEDAMMLPTDLQRYASEGDFSLCIALILISLAFEVVGAITVVRWGGTGPLPLLGAIASASNVISPLYLNQVLALGALILIAYLTLRKGRRGGGTG